VYFNLLDDIGVALHGRPSALLEHFRSDYGVFQVDDLPANKVNIAVEFVDERSDPRACVDVGEQVSYDGRGVFLRDSQYHAFRIDFDSARARTWQASCDANFDPRHFDRILEHLIHFQLLKRGKTLCRAAAFRAGGKVVLCTGWRDIGKTNLLLHFLRDGANYIGDGWTVVHGAGTVQGLPKRLGLLYHNLMLFPDLMAHLPDQSAALLDFVEHARGGDYELNENVVHVLEERARVQVPPAELFGQATEGEASPIDRVFVLQGNDAGEGAVTVETMDHDALVTSLAALLEFEQSDLMHAYTVFRARSGRRVDLLDLARSGGEAVLTSAFAGVTDIHRVTIPACCNSQAVYTALTDCLLGGGAGRAAGQERGPGRGCSPAAA
jgi:hypothetical protein